jgi:hypothetical protein
MLRLEDRHTLLKPGGIFRRPKHLSRGPFQGYFPDHNEHANCWHEQASRQEELEQFCF